MQQQMNGQIRAAHKEMASWKWAAIAKQAVDREGDNKVRAGRGTD